MIAGPRVAAGKQVRCSGGILFSVVILFTSSLFIPDLPSLITARDGYI